jgi:hypothetical protein
VAIRGSSSATANKKSYRVELQNDDGTDRKEPLLGFPSNSDWILYASYFDRTFVRDALAYELWRDMGYYAPRTRYVELFINTSADATAPSHYAGLYVLIEKIKRAKSRVNIARLRPSDTNEPAVTGGYLLKKDRFKQGDRGFQTPRGIAMYYAEPKGREINARQELWLTNYINKMEDVLFSEQFRDPSTGYVKYLDTDSFVDYHWIVEVSRNADALWVSQYFHLDRGGKLKAGPIWDWDLSFGNTQFEQSFNTEGWRWTGIRGEHYLWYTRLFEDIEFLQRYVDRWSELRRSVFATSNVLAKVDRLADEIRTAQARNYARWPSLKKTMSGTNAHDEPVLLATHTAHVDWLKNWITARLSWIDSQDFQAPHIHITSEAGVVPLTVQLAGDGGKIYYTVDGSDPRASGGTLSANAMEATNSIIVSPGATVRARIRGEFNLWSAPLTSTPQPASGLLKASH